jgi:hypothetical protein
VDLDMKRDPVPFPGKGENSWDCGEDASYGFGCAAETLEEGIGKFVASKLRDRGRNGGRGWTPTEDHRPKDARA